MDSKYKSGTRDECGFVHCLEESDSEQASENKQKKTTTGETLYVFRPKAGKMTMLPKEPLGRERM